MRSKYETKKAARIERYEQLAVNFEKASQIVYNQSKTMADCIPMGQPILVGHHSEKRDRRFRERIWNKLGESVKLQEKAEYYAEKAEIAKDNDAISSDDPQALIKLREKLAGLQAHQQLMKDINKILRMPKLSIEEKRERLQTRI